MVGGKRVSKRKRKQQSNKAAKTSKAINKTAVGASLCQLNIDSFPLLHIALYDCIM